MEKKRERNCFFDRFFLFTREIYCDLDESELFYSIINEYISKEKSKVRCLFQDLIQK